MNVSTFSGGSRPFLTATLAIGLAALIAAGAIAIDRGYRQNSTPAYPTNAISAGAAKLDMKPRTIELISEKAIRVRKAIRQSDYTTAHKIAADVLSDSQLQNWRFYPFSDFVVGITDSNDPSFETRLNEWVAQNENDAIPILIRAQYYVDMAWFKRGMKFSRQTRVDDLAFFNSYMKQALADVDASLRLSDRNPYAFYLKLRILQGLYTQQGMMAGFEEAIAKHPNYYPLYDIVLSTLQPKWGGTVEAMYAFVDRYAGSAAEYSPLKLLYLDLYRYLLSSAAISCGSNWRDADKMAACMASAVQKVVTPELDTKVQAALQLYDHVDKYQFGVAVEDMLFGMLTTSGGGVYSGAILERAAAGMHGDTQLKPDKPVDNNYIIDMAVAASWYTKGFYDNALQKSQEALKDAKVAAFPSEEEKDLAVARIYRQTAEIYERLRQYPDMIAQETAATELGGANTDEHFICYGYYQLKSYEDSIRACTKIIDAGTANLKAFYWRGEAYRSAGQMDAALRDLTIVADSEDGFRATAAIDVSMIYFNRNDIQGALNVLNKYTYLYDPTLSSKSDAAVGYNNRCYAYMQLNELQKALDDCVASLKFGTLPDAFRKQEELIKRLGATSGQTKSTGQ